MKRYTEKGVNYCEKENAEMHKEQLTHIYEFYENIGKMENKLRKLEDIEEEIGCPLDVIGKALIQNCFYVEQWNEYRETDIGFIPEEQIFVISIDEWENGNTLLLSDYKKTWWLKEDKSE